MIPEDYRYPQKGDLYESKIDQTIEFMTAWEAPFTGGGESKLFKGEKIWISSDPIENKPISTYALPADYRMNKEWFHQQIEMHLNMVDFIFQLTQKI